MVETWCDSDEAEAQRIFRMIQDNNVIYPDDPNDAHWMAASLLAFFEDSSACDRLNALLNEVFDRSYAKDTLIQA
jgi:hypothetical protein